MKTGYKWERYTGDAAGKEKWRAVPALREDKDSAVDPQQRGSSVQATRWRHQDTETGN